MYKSMQDFFQLTIYNVQCTINNLQFTKGLGSLVQMDRVGTDTKRCASVQTDRIRTKHKHSTKAARTLC